ncbi:unnamed protein product, partial [Mesorhabditis spiculigera]
MARVHYASGSFQRPPPARIEGKSPLAVIFACRGSMSSNDILYIHSMNNLYREEAINSMTVVTRRDCPKRIVNKFRDVKESMRTPFGLSLEMLSNILCVKESANDMPFEMKLGRLLYVGFPKSIAATPAPALMEEQLDGVHIAFVLPEGTSYHLIERFQCLSRKIAYAIDSLQQISNYLDREYKAIHYVLEDFRRIPENEARYLPWEKVRKTSKLAALLSQVFEDLHKTGVVQVFMENFIEIGFCLEARALEHAHLTPRSAVEIDRLVSRIRPYHSVLLLEDVTPSPDSNPNVALMIRHCDPDRSILDISTASGIPLIQVLMVVRHLLIWARAVVIYPIVNTNVYSSATTNKDLERENKRFNKFFGHLDTLGRTLSYFNPPIQLDKYVEPLGPLVEQQVKTRIVVYLLRHQLLMQLHTFAYLLPPYSTDDQIPDAPCPASICAMIDEVPTAIHPHEPLPDDEPEPEDLTDSSSDIDSDVEAPIPIISHHHHHRESEDPRRWKKNMQAEELNAEIHRRLAELPEEELKQIPILNAAQMAILFPPTSSPESLGNHFRPGPGRYMLSDDESVDYDRDSRRAYSGSNHSPRSELLDDETPLSRAEEMTEDFMVNDFSGPQSEIEDELCDGIDPVEPTEAIGESEEQADEQTLALPANTSSEMSTIEDTMKDSASPSRRMSMTLTASPPQNYNDGTDADIEDADDGISSGDIELQEQLDVDSNVAEEKKSEEDTEPWALPPVKLRRMERVPPVSGIPAEVKVQLKKICGQMLLTESLAEVESRIRHFCQLAPLLDGSHHVEDLMYRFDLPRQDIMETFSHFSTIVATYLRPDFISCIDDTL